MIDLNGQRVSHKTLGSGVVNSQSAAYIKVSFESKTSQFTYPDAFEKFLILDDSQLQQKVLAELQVKQEAIQAQQELVSKQLSATRSRASVVGTRAVSRKNERLNIAFKCNYCDGGRSKLQIGYNGVCSDEVIENNIYVEHRSWCSQYDSECLRYMNGEISRSELDDICDDGEGFVCYESQILRNWRAFAGIYQSGTKAGQPMKLKQVQPNSLCVLTTRDPRSDEDTRYVFGAFLVDETYEGDYDREGYVSTKSKYRIKLSPAEAHEILFWKYYANQNSANKPRWGTGLHRYMDDIIAIQILMDIATIKAETADGALANEFVEYFARSNRIDPASIPVPNGALTYSTHDPSLCGY